MKNPKDLNIFIVDDNPFCLYLYETHLQKSGFVQITTFNNGWDCINQLNHAPDIIFIDQDMEPINGLAVLKQIKQHSPDAMVVMVSSRRQVREAVEALKIGAHDYIIKDGNEAAQMIHTLQYLAFTA